MMIKDIYFTFKVGFNFYNRETILIRSKYDTTGNYIVKFQEFMTSYNGIMTMPIEEFYILDYEKNEIVVVVDVHPNVVKAMSFPLDG